MPTEMELVLEQTQQGTSYEVSVSTEGVEELKRKVKIKGEKKEALLTLRQKLVLSEAALTKVEQIKLATKRSKKDFHVSHASGSGDGVNTKSKVLDEQQPKTFGINEEIGTKPGVPDVPPYESESDKESWGDSKNDDGDNDNDNDNDSESDDHDDERIESDSDEILDLNLTNKIGDPTQSYFVSSGFTRKLLNLDNPSPADNEIASLMVTTTQYATVIPKITSSFTTTGHPPPSFLHPLQQEATPTPTPTTSTNPIQTNQFAEVVSSIPGIIHKYIASKMKEAVDLTMKTIIKDQVKDQVSKIIPKIEKGRDDQDKDEDLSAGSDRGMKRRKSGKDVESSKDSRSKEKKSSSTFKDASHHKSSGKSSHAEKPSHTVEDSCMQQDKSLLRGTTMNNSLTMMLPKLTGSRNPSGLQLLILIG
nr:hypothetical protein [Tanacetum cinerariifolium]